MKSGADPRARNLMARPVVTSGHWPGQDPSAHWSASRTGAVNSYTSRPPSSGRPVTMARRWR